jgi:hypothetical protein
VNQNVTNPLNYYVPDLGMHKGGPTPPPPPPPTTALGLDYRSFINAIKPIVHSSPTSTNIIDNLEFPTAAIFSTTTSGITRTATQQALYNYGNEVGSYIQTYEQAHQDQTSVLMNQLQDPQNPGKVLAVKNMARDMQSIGESLMKMEDVPSQITKQHTSLAQSYIEIGKNLALVPDAQSSAQLLNAIKIYNDSADTFATNFVAEVAVFGKYKVSFSPDEAGSVFMFSMSVADQQ